MNQRRDRSPLGGGPPTPKLKPPQWTPQELAEKAQKMMWEHDCHSIEVCEAFCKDLVKLVGDKIQMIEIDKLRRPCAAIMSLQAAGILTRLNIQRPDPNADLVPDMDEEGANEPTLVVKDCF